MATTDAPFGDNSSAPPRDGRRSDEPNDDDFERGRHRSKRIPSTLSSSVSPSVPLTKNRSTGNLGLAIVDEHPQDRPPGRIRFSLDASAADYDSVTRSSFITDHDHGLGPSGLRRIRQQPPLRTPTLPSSAASSRSPSVGLARSTSLSLVSPPPNERKSMSSGPTSPSFTEDLSRFPSESLHSFSFAHQSEEFVHNRQNVLKRSIEFMKDRMGWLVSSNAAIASAQARVNGDLETQDMLDLLAKAHLVGTGNLPSSDSFVAPGPLTGPAEVSGDNVFENQFFPRTDSPEFFSEPLVPPSTTVRAPAHGQSVVLDPLDPVTKEEKPATEKRLDVPRDQMDSENSSRTPTNESGTTAQTSPPGSQRPSLRRTFTDVGSASTQQKLMDAMAQPFMSNQSSGYADALISPTLTAQPSGSSFGFPGALGPAVHGHSSRWAPAAQAIFTTLAKPPWTILAANDLACLVFGVTKAEVRKIGILEVVQEERRAWLEHQLQQSDSSAFVQASENPDSPATVQSGASSVLGGRGGITAQLLSKPNSRTQPPKVPDPRRAQTVHNGDPSPAKPRARSKSRGVLLCGDVVPIQKRNGATGSASLWVKEKGPNLIWVVEEIHEHAAFLRLDDDGVVTKITGETGYIWGLDELAPGMDVGKLITRIPRQGIDPRTGAVDYAQIAKRRYFTCRNSNKMNIPATVTQTRGEVELRVSSYPHIAGIVVVSPQTLKIKSSNSAFSGALFGYERPEGMLIQTLLPDFNKVLALLTEHDGVELQDGIVIPEHSFRRAWALLALQEGRPDAASIFLNPDGLVAKHRDGSQLKIDMQMRVVKSEKSGEKPSRGSNRPSTDEEAVVESELVYALWITYSRSLHTTNPTANISSPMLSGLATPLHQPSPGQTSAEVPTPIEGSSDVEESKSEAKASVASALTQQLRGVAISAAGKLTKSTKSDENSANTGPAHEPAPPRKKTIGDFVILEDMGQGAYGQVKLARYKYGNGRKVVLKYVTKRRILVDTWTRDRRLGTVPLEIHVLEYLRRGDLKHPNIMEMEDFFEDETNYYIEMAPHGLPGMDLFDYIELRTNMHEDECRSIFVQVAKAIHHLHIKAKVVHRDIKDENVILDGEGNIKLIDFGSAAYIKSGPFDVFVGTIDYAAPEVLAGKPYGGKEQDVWALGILLYTIVYKENPFYSIDEIMDRDLRVPYTISEDSIDLIRCMLNRDVSKRYDIDQVLGHPWCKAVE